MNLQDKKNKLFLILVAILITNAVVAEIIGSKLFSLEKTLGFELMNFSILGIDNLSITLTAGVISWPLIFTITDILNDYYGYKTVRFISYITAIMISFMFILVYIAIKVKPIDYWVLSQQKNGIENMQIAYKSILGQGLNIIVGSLIAFLIGQIFDAYIFKTIKKITGDKFIWARALISTLISQLIDTVIVLLIAFHLMQKYPLKLVFAWIITIYIYKFCAAILFLPLVYFIHFVIEKYLGTKTATEMRLNAIKNI